MRRVAIGIVIGMMFAASAAAAEDSDKAAPKCEVAEINPVTGHLLCLKPHGAPVEPPPEDIAPPCNADESRGQWTWSPNCRDAKGS